MSNAYFEESGVYIAPAGTSCEDMMKALGYSFRAGRGYARMSDAQGELLYRVNAHVQGNNPGEPMNWKGERGLLQR
jgi:hypothetical protein